MTGNQSRRLHFCSDAKMVGKCAGRKAPTLRVFLQELRGEVLENDENDAEIAQGTKPAFRGVLRT
ncbi:MAG: hypothetical protein AUG81_10130 [Verrucomicrobia bacterium 13_1_20CM_4_54_11]|nr:MAG: hypothetical protein AUI00_02300 [Verrucomicrobia bacterium 13_2_20CM_2_54_15]OLD86966.1 MAG: hypothetical protein AUG81_10130 [Verrucomicrobia bacterium 13_1_20CM_4_54_11]